MKKGMLRIVVLVLGFLIATVFWQGSNNTVLSTPAAEENLAPVLSLGKILYEERCMQCHGRDGRGNGPAAPLLSPKPRDFSSGKFKFRSTESGSIPTDQDLIRSINEGIHGTSMTGWSDFVAGDSLTSVVEYVKMFSPRFARETPMPVRVGSPVPSSSSSIATGRKVYQTLQCGVCHGEDGTGKGAIATDFMDEWEQPVGSTDLTQPWNFRGGATARDIFLRLRTGMDGTPMPSYTGSATDIKLWHLANYILSIGRKPVWEMDEHELREHYASIDVDAKKDPAKWGRYLVRVFGCAECHSPIRADGTLIDEYLLAGGQRFDPYPFGVYVTYNLTSDPETGLGKWSDDEIRNALTKGIRKDGSRMLPFPMAWPAYGNMKEGDVKAIIAYLRTVPPVYNKIPGPESLNLFSYLWGKFRMLILKDELPAYIYPGNSGTSRADVVTATGTSKYPSVEEEKQ